MGSPNGSKNPVYCLPVESAAQSRVSMSSPVCQPTVNGVHATSQVRGALPAHGFRGFNLHPTRLSCSDAKRRRRDRR